MIAGRKKEIAMRDRTNTRKYKKIRETLAPAVTRGALVRLHFAGSENEAARFTLNEKEKTSAVINS